MKKCSVVCLALFSAFIVAAGLAAAERRPSVLFCTPLGATYGWVGLTYMAELHAKGFEVDYTENLSNVTWERVRDYNVLVLYVLPGQALPGWDPPHEARPGESSAQEFTSLVERYVSGGGGVLLMPPEDNWRRQKLFDLTELFGAKLPLELIVEKDPEKVAVMTRSGLPLAYTDQVSPSSVSEGVSGVWYPYAPAYNAQFTGPISVGENWTVVVRASQTAETQPIDLSKSRAPEIEQPFVRPGGVKQPPIFAIRTYKDGRVALVNQWCQYSIGQGTQWLYNREVLERGLKGKPSDFGRLLENTFRWLAEPSLKSGAVGGHVTDPERLLPPNHRPQAKKQFEERSWHYYGHQPPGQAKPFRGLIGVKSSHSTGQGTVEEYARAARKAGLDFLVFMEDYRALTPDSFESLKRDCKKHSDDALKLIPGFTIRNNIGNRLFFFGEDPELPPDFCLTGPDKKVFYWQEQKDDGSFTGNFTQAFWWLFNYHTQDRQVGYYDFSESGGKGMRLPDLRMYAMVGLRYYRDGKLVEDVTNEFLTTAQGTLAPAPVSVNEVSSPEELVRELESGHSLTFAQARSLRTILADALRWAIQYDGFNTFLSDGPRILAWPACHRVMTYGAEEFVTGPAVMPSPILVTSEKGLREIRIYNGRDLFRRFVLHGEKEFYQTLVLEGTVQKNLVLVAEDVQGGQAVSFARRCWKEGGRAVVFCSDRTNDCRSTGMLLARGPIGMLVTWVPPLPDDIAGSTWDGGPAASLPLVSVSLEGSRPVLTSDKGVEEGSRFSQTPLLGFSDEGAVDVTSEQKQVFDQGVEKVVNPWVTYGPLGGPSRLFEFNLRYREYVTPTVGVPGTGWAAQSVRQGINACLFRSEITFKEDQTVASLLLMRGGLALRDSPTFLVLALGAAEPSVMDVGALAAPQTVTLSHGDWFALYSTKLASSHVFVNTGGPLRLEISNPGQRGDSFNVWAPMEGKSVLKGETRAWELFSLGVPLDVEVRDLSGVLRLVSYLREPAGLQVLRGRRLDSPALLELEPDDWAAEILVPRPEQNLHLTLPLRVSGLNPRWSAGLFQKAGYVKGDYGTGENRYRALGLDADGNAYVPLYVDLAEKTQMLAGHPVVAGPEGRDLFIQVTRVASDPPAWHVSVNNPTDQPVTTTLRKAMDLPGLELQPTRVTLPPGGYEVLM